MGFGCASNVTVSLSGVCVCVYFVRVYRGWISARARYEFFFFF